MPKRKRSTPARVAADELLGDLRFYSVPEGEVPEAALLVIKTRDADGRIGWFSRVSQTYNQLEFLGAVEAYVDSERRGLSKMWAEDDDAPPDHVQ
jgi:hypothetical protein